MTELEYSALAFWGLVPKIEWHEENGLPTCKVEKDGKQYTARLTIHCTHLTIALGTEIVKQYNVQGKLQAEVLIAEFLELK